MEKNGEETRREYLTISAVEPHSGKTLDVLISYERIHWLKQYGQGRIKECGYTVPQVLQKPSAIFEGLCSDADEDARGCGWRCYCGIPRRDFAQDGQEKSPRPGKVFLVFVNVERVAYSWRWEKCDVEDSKLPIG